MLLQVGFLEKNIVEPIIEKNGSVLQWIENGAKFLKFQYRKLESFIFSFKQNMKVVTNDYTFAALMKVSFRKLKIMYRARWTRKLC